MKINIKLIQKVRMCSLDLFFFFQISNHILIKDIEKGKTLRMKCENVKLAPTLVSFDWMKYSSEKLNTLFC